MMKNKQILLIACFLLACEYSFFSTSLAHESAPSRAWLSIYNQNELSMAIALDVESFIANTTDATAQTHSEAHDLVTKVSQNLGSSLLSTKIHNALRDGRSPVALFSRGKALDLTLESVAIDPEVPRAGGRNATLVFSARLMPDDAFVRLQPSKVGGALIASVHVNDADNLNDADLTYYVPAGEVSPPIILRGMEFNRWSLASNYLKAGFVHVLPKGIDHVLFVIALMLLVTGWRQLSLYIALFTLAHSITLVLAAMGYVNISGGIVEPFIAASIIYMAVERFRNTPQPKLQAIMVFVFGLAHGLGFANVLSTSGLTVGSFISALVAFNIGIELAHIVVVACCATISFVVMRAGSRRNNPLATPASLLIGSVGSWMLIERTLL